MSSESVQNNYEESVDKPLWKFVTKKDKIEGGGNLEFQCKFARFYSVVLILE